MNFNQKNWSIQSEILKRVQKEELVNWSKTPQSDYRPKYTEPPKEKLSAGIYNFILSLRP